MMDGKLRHVPMKVPTTSRRRVSGVALAWLALAAGPTAPQLPPRQATTMSPVENIRPLRISGAHPVFSARGDRLVFDRVDDLGYSRIYVADADGTAARCLTCEPVEFRRLHTASAVWHPSGEYMVFHAEQPVRQADRPLPYRAVPGGNRGESLWGITANGGTFWNLARRGEEGIRFSSPRFSPEGGKLLWSERIASGGGAWGRWATMVAEFRVSRGIPRLKDPKAHEPGPQRLYLETGDFSRDENGALIAANLEPAQSEMGLDLYELVLETGAVRRLTRTPDQLDRYPRYSPNGDWVAWASNRDIVGHPTEVRRAGSITTATDLWLMPTQIEAPEAQAVRLTRFSDVFSQEYTGKMTVGPPAWHPQGDRLVVSVAPVDRPQESELYEIRFNGPIGR